MRSFFSAFNFQDSLNYLLIGAFCLRRQHKVLPIIAFLAFQFVSDATLRLEDVRNDKQQSHNPPGLL